MNNKEFLNFSDFDIFAKRLGLHYKGKEKISSYFGLSLTLIYVVISLTIFIYYTISVIKGYDFQVHDSTEYSLGAPSINLNNSNLFYFAFGVENAVNASRFVDETIYTARARYYYGEKNSGGAFITKEYRDLKIEKCKVEKFGKEYQHLFISGEFDDSYCVDNFDIVLTGGFIYDKFSCIRIFIYPCVNKTENNNHCKPQEEIDKVLAGGYFSVLLKDIGLNPTNYSNPILPTIQDFYTTISKDFYKDIIMNYEITDVESDYGLFYEKKTKERYLKFDRIKESFFFRDAEKYYYKGKDICKVEIRLSDNIHVQRREYKKMSSVFSTTGGYMQVLYSFFLLISLIPSQFNFRKIIVNGLLNIEFKNSKSNFNISRQFNNNASPNIIFVENEKSQNNSINNEIQSINFKNLEKNKSNGQKNKNSEKGYTLNISKNMNSTFKNKELNSSSENQKNISFLCNNISKIEMVPKNAELNVMSVDKGSANKSVYSSNKYIFNYPKENTFFNSAKGKGIKEIKFNIFDYYCLGKWNYNKLKKIKLFNKGCRLYTEQLDIIHIFRHLLDIEKSLKEKRSITEGMKLLKQTSI